MEFFGSLIWSCVGNEGCGRAWLKQANSLESAAIAMLLAEKFFLITELVLHQGPKCMWALIGLAVSCQVVARSMVSKSIPHSVIML